MKYEKKIEKTVVETPRHTIVISTAEYKKINKLLRDSVGISTKDSDKIGKLGTVKAITLTTDTEREIRLEVVVK